MWQNAHDAYLESRILAAEPLELVRLLYQAATAAVRNARHHLASGDIGARSRSITQACSILIELTASLDRQRGGEISARLAGLYDYITGRLIEANFRQEDATLAEALGLLVTLSEGWDGVKQQTRNEAEARVAAPNPWAQGSDAGRPSQAWSF